MSCTKPKSFSNILSSVKSAKSAGSTASPFYTISTLSLKVENISPVPVTVTFLIVIEPSKLATVFVIGDPLNIITFLTQTQFDAVYTELGKSILPIPFKFSGSMVSNPLIPITKNISAP